MIVKDFTINGCRFQIEAFKVTIHDCGGTETDHDAVITDPAQADDFGLYIADEGYFDSKWDEAGDFFYATIDAAIAAAHEIAADLA